jgi:hypothetical protein
MKTPPRVVTWSAVVVGASAAAILVLGWAVRRYGVPFLRSVLEYQEEMRDELTQELGRAPTNAEHQAYLAAKSDQALAALGMTAPQRRSRRR